MKIESELAEVILDNKVDHIIKEDRNQKERYFKVDKLRKDRCDFLIKEKILFIHSIHIFFQLSLKLSNSNLLSILSLSI